MPAPDSTLLVPQMPLHDMTSDGTCPWCGYAFMELYLHFGSDDAAFDCSQCGKAITGYRDIIFRLHPDKRHLSENGTRSATASGIPKSVSLSSPKDTGESKESGGQS